MRETILCESLLINIRLSLSLELYLYVLIPFVSISKYSNYHTTPVCISICMCVYMSHTATVGCRIATDSPAPVAQENGSTCGLIV